MILAMLIVHRCTGCNHPDMWGTPTQHSVLGLGRPVNCGQRCHPRCQWDPQPTTMRRFAFEGTEVTDVIPPGTAVQGYTTGTTCDCTACRDLHTELSGQQASR